MCNNIISIENIINIKINMLNKTYNDILNRFYNVKIVKDVFDFEIYYKNNIKVPKLKNGNDYVPFRNASYKTIIKNNIIIAYSKKNKYSCENIIIRKDKKIKIYCENDKDSKILIRLITELVIRKLLEKNYFPIHSSCVEINKKAVLFFGKKGSGKSTALLTNILLNKAHLIGNDITFVGKENGKWYATGIPYDLTFNKDFYKDINENVIKKSNILTQEENDKIRFNTLDFCKYFKTTYISKAEISEINLVNLNKENKYEKKIINNKNVILKYLDEFGKDDNFDFDDILLINNFLPNFNYKGLCNDIDFYKIEGNILKYYLGDKHE